ncbi:MAG TPA: serine/threonine-protein kinase [Chloroflexota bacterium]|nr:serine/threonine-protein kinase [Chloroflexota bacterium]
MSELVAPCSTCGLHHSDAVMCPISHLLAGDARLSLAGGTIVARRYQIIELLHKGPMSTVYRATDAGRGGQCIVLKELNLHALPPAEAAEAFTWFLREAHLLSTIRHRALPRLYASFTEGAHHYLVMEEIPGLSLEILARKGPLPEDQVLRWGLELCEVLHFLHSRREPIVYRDLKPGNVLEHAQTGKLVLVDFGVARRATPGQIGTAVGTPGYAAPEQYQGLADARSDLYALGATLHRLLTGYDAEQEHPFRQPPVLALRHTVTSATAAIVDRALSLEPGKRYRSARAMRDALRNALKHAPERRYAVTAPFYLWISVQPLIVVPAAMLFLPYVVPPLHLGIWMWPVLLLCLYAPTLLYRVPLRRLHRSAQAHTDQAILQAVHGARRHFRHRFMVGVGFWLLIILSGYGVNIVGIPLFLLTIQAILMWRVGVGRAAIGARSRPRSRQLYGAKVSSPDQLAPDIVSP